jgi:hypothetical protein
MLAHVVEADRELVSKMIDDCLRDADSARFGQALQTRRDVDTFAVAVVLIEDDITQRDAHPDIDATIACQIFVAPRHLALKKDCAVDSIHDTAEFSHEATAHKLEDASVVLLDFRLEHLFSMFLQSGEGVGFIYFHKT